MRMGMEVDQSDARKLDHAMKVLPERVYRRVVGSAASYGMTPLVKTMRKQYPGFIGDAVKKKRKNYRRTKSVYVGVGPESKTIVVRTPSGNRVKKNPATVARWFEEGTAPHAISARFAGGGMKIGPVIISGTVQHPGVKPRPVGRQAYYAHRKQVVQRVRAKTLKGIDKQVRILGTK